MENKIIIDNQALEIYPEIRLACIRFKTDVKPSSETFWDYLDKTIIPQVKANIEGKSWSEIPGVKGSRAAYKAFGRDPTRYRVSSEALLRRVKRGDELYHINTVIDVNNMISIQSGLSLGSYDVDKLSGSITLRKANEGEGYFGIGKEFLDMHNLIVIADNEGIFGSTMSDSTRAMVTEKTKDILVVIWCFEKEINLEELLNYAVDAFKEYSNAQDIETWFENN